VDYPNGYQCADFEHTVIRGAFWTNAPKSESPRRVVIYGNYTRNDEMIWNFGFVKGQKGAGLNLSRWKSTADIILVAEAKDGREGRNSGYTEANGPYIEPGATNWNEVFAQLSGRHGGGQVCLFADGHVSFKKLDWFRTKDGKHAICPAQEDTSNGTAW
jgi:prepilin-type processing-associated H-X9-DG protein